MFYTIKRWWSGIPKGKLRCTVYLKSGRSFDTFIGEKETYNIEHFTDKTIWGFRTAQANQFVAGDRIDYIEVR